MAPITPTLYCFSILDYLQFISMRLPQRRARFVTLSQKNQQSIRLLILYNTGESPDGEFSPKASRLLDYKSRQHSIQRQAAVSDDSRRTVDPAPRQHTPDRAAPSADFPFITGHRGNCRPLSGTTDENRTSILRYNLILSHHFPHVKRYLETNREIGRVLYQIFWQIDRISWIDCGRGTFYDNDSIILKEEFADENI
ncbi:MAG: hypothetical protein LUD79_06910 [Oscillospiraceae bacterium]|nr:hypothetical protein [Oscillospiraceae bacterium]